MKNKGFTLAEVLVTLGIVGVVAALSMPAITQAAARAKIGPELLQAMTVLSSATKQLMQDYNADYLSVALRRHSGANTTMGDLFDVLTDKESAKGFYISANTGSVGATNVLAFNDGASEVYGTFGTVYKLPSRVGFAAVDNACKPGGPNNGCAVLIFTSSAGTAKPLLAGKHAFRVYVYEDGRVEVPENWGDTCADDIKLAGANNTGIDCAGRISVKGWKVDY